VTRFIQILKHMMMIVIKEGTVIRTNIGFSYIRQQIRFSNTILYRLNFYNHLQDQKHFNMIFES
jgi:hypothetical protein